MRKKLEITPSEMLEMRKEGLSNRDIAYVLDISDETVRRYIGPQGGRMESLRCSAPKRKKKEEPKPVEVVVPPTPEFVPSSETYGFDCNMSITLDHKNERVCFHGGGHTVYFPFINTPDVVRFLAWAMQSRMKEHDDENKA